MFVVALATMRQGKGQKRMPCSASLKLSMYCWLDSFGFMMQEALGDNSAVWASILSSMFDPNIHLYNVHTVHALTISDSGSAWLASWHSPTRKPTHKGQHVETCEVQGLNKCLRLVWVKRRLSQVAWFSVSVPQTDLQKVWTMVEVAECLPFASGWFFFVSIECTQTQTSTLQNPVVSKSIGLNVVLPTQVVL